MSLAKELKNGSAKIISEWPLFERAVESVIGTLRENKAASGLNLTALVSHITDLLPLLYLLASLARRVSA